MSTLALTRQRCWTHSVREAAARCPSCGRFFCRECVTEHEGRVVCAACLRARTADKNAASAPAWRWLGTAWTAARRGLALASAALVTWFLFHAVGQTLLSLSDQFHEGTVWEAVTDPAGGPSP